MIGDGVSPLLQARDVKVAYGNIEVLNAVSLDVKTSQTLAIIGPNGAGKTTLFKALTGEIPCRGGSIFFEGRDVTSASPHQRTSLGMGRTFQVSRVFLEFSVRDNVVTAIESKVRNAGARNAPWWHWQPSKEVVEEAEVLLSQLGIFDRRHLAAAALSHGDRKRLELAITLALEPRMLLLDEPTAGMAPADRMQIVELIRVIRAERGVSVLMTEHDMDVIFNLADEVVVMNYGKIIASGSVQDVRSDPVVREVYLGQDMYDAARSKS